jgi:hypothetical protein
MIFIFCCVSLYRSIRVSKGSSKKNKATRSCLHLHDAPSCFPVVLSLFRFCVARLLFALPSPFYPTSCLIFSSSSSFVSHCFIRHSFLFLCFPCSVMSFLRFFSSVFPSFLSPLPSKFQQFKTGQPNCISKWRM